MNNPGFTQDLNKIRITETFDNQPLEEFLSTLRNKYVKNVFYKSTWVEPYTLTKSFDNTPLIQALNAVFLDHDLTYKLFQDNSIIIIKKASDTRTNFDDASQLLIIGDPLNLGLYKTATLKGRVIDGKTGETLEGAVISNKKSENETTTDKNGEFLLEIPVGDYQLQISYVGFENSNPKIRLIEDGSADFELYEESYNIGEITVLGTETDIPQTQMSILQMNSKELKQLPSMMGETDILKSFTMLAGVQTVSELSSGFNVRGGNTDQNLILLNGSPVFNSSHLFGFLSLINPDLVQDVRLFKGGVPVKLGERVSSVMEVNFKEGNDESLKIYGGIGLINSRMTLDGPITKNKKFTFITGGRSSYSNWMLKKIPDLNLTQSVTHFYDLSGKFTFRFNPHNKLNAMVYASNDEFSTSSQTVTQYGSLLGNLTANNRFTETLYGELEIAYSKYNYRLTDYANEKPQEAYYLKNSLLYKSAGYNFKWHINSRHIAEAGLKVASNQVSPGEIVSVRDITSIANQRLHDEKLIETVVFVGDEFKISPRFSVSYGIRYNYAANIGKPIVYVYDPNKPIIPENVVDSLHYSSKEVSSSYMGFEPRVSLDYDLDLNSSLKISYQRIRQNIFQLSNNAVISPAETWKTIDYHMKPIISDQVAVGIERVNWLNRININAEIYYKNLQNLIEYKNGTHLIMNPNIETALIPTKGYTYGFELSANKNTGRLTGYVSYVYSRSMQKNTSKFENENFWNGKYYKSNNDRPHDFSVTTTYNISHRWRVSGNFVFVSGRPMTLPELKYSFANEHLIYYSERNAYRMPAYNRFDIAITLDENLRKKRMWKGSWTLSVYNVYGRKNPYSVYYKKSNPAESNDFKRYSLYKLSLIGIPVPSLTYNFKF